MKAGLDSFDTWIDSLLATRSTSSVAKDPSKLKDEPSLPSEQETKTSHIAVVVEKGLDDVLPELGRRSLDDLANPTGVSMLVAMVKEAKGKELAIREENKELRDLAARNDQAQKTMWTAPIIMTLGGALVTAFSWSIPPGVAGALTVIGAGLIFVGGLVQARSDPSKGSGGK
jgi:hypothetical protein